MSFAFTTFPTETASTEIDLTDSAGAKIRQRRFMSMTHTLAKIDRRLVVAKHVQVVAVADKLLVGL